MHEGSLYKQMSLKAAVPLQMPSYAGAVDSVPTAPLRSPGENLGTTDEEDWLRQDPRDHLPMHLLFPMAFLHGISFLLQDYYWSIDSANSYSSVEDHRPCSQKTWSQGTALPLTLDAD